jgi:hypothetical protein
MSIRNQYNKYTLLYVLLIPVIVFLSSGCASAYKVRTEVLPSVGKFYSSYPSIEVDIAAVSDSVAGQLKAAKVEDYFAPNSSLRSSIQPKTYFFTSEGQAAITLASRDKIWQTWLAKKPTTIFVIASLPPDPSLSAGAPDPRMLFIPMKKAFIIAHTITIDIGPQGISQKEE